MNSWDHLSTEYSWGKMADGPEKRQNLKCLYENLMSTNNYLAIYTPTTKVIYSSDIYFVRKFEICEIPHRIVYIIQTSSAKIVL